MCEQTSILYAFTLKNPIPMIIALSALSQIKLFICSNMFTFVCRNLITMQNVVYSARLVMVRAGNLLIVECNSSIYIPLVLLKASKIFCGFWWSFRRGFYTQFFSDDRDMVSLVIEMIQLFKISLFKVAWLCIEVSAQPAKV